MTKTVYVVGGDSLVMQMFGECGWDALDESNVHEPFLKPDLVVFTGGADVCPDLYGEVNTDSHCDPERDNREVNVYNEYVYKTPLVGICRGGQLLNVLNGGKMVQDHGLISGIVSAWAFYEQDGTEYKVHVDHHQGILPRTGEGGGFIHGPDIPSGEHIAYVYWYPKTRSLCFQPHPEWGHEPTRDLFFNLLDQYL